MDSKIKETFQWALRIPRSSNTHFKTLLDENQPISEKVNPDSISTDQSNSCQNKETLKLIGSADKKARSTLFEIFTSCFCIQIEPSGLNNEASLNSSPHHCRTRYFAKNKTRKSIDHGNQHLTEISTGNNPSLTVKDNQVYSSESDYLFSCCQINSNVHACGNQHVTRHNDTVGDLSQSDELVKVINQLNHLLSIRNDGKLTSNNGDLTTDGLFTSEDERDKRSRQSDIISRVANEVFCASNLLSNAIDMLRKHVLQTLDNTSKDNVIAYDSLLHRNFSTSKYHQHSQRYASLSKAISQQAVVNVLDDTQEISVISSKSVVACALVSKVEPTIRNSFQRVTQNVLISIEDVDAIEPVHRKQSPSIAPELDMQAHRITRQTHLCLNDTDMSKLQIKARYPMPSETEFEPNETFKMSKSVDFDCVKLIDVQKNSPNRIKRIFQLIHPKENLNTKAYEVLTTDETERIRSLPNWNEGLSRPFTRDSNRRAKYGKVKKSRSMQLSDCVQVKSSSFSYMHQSKIHSMRHMMAGDSHVTQWSRVLSTATPGGDYGPAYEGAIELNVRTNTQKIQRGNLIMTPNNPSQSDSLTDSCEKALPVVGCQTISRYNEFPYEEVPRQRNNHNQKITSTTSVGNAAAQQEENSANSPKPSSSVESSGRYMNEVSLADQETQLVQSMSGGQVEVTIGTSSNGFVAINQTDPIIQSQIQASEDTPLLVFGQDTVLDQSTQTASLANVHETADRYLGGNGLDSQTAQRHGTIPSGEGDDPRYRLRQQMRSTSRRILRSRRQATHLRHAHNNQSRHTAPASISTEQHPPPGALGENVRSLVDDAYDSILEQIQMLFTSNDEFGWSNRWRTLVHVPGPHSGDVTVQTDNAIGANVTTTPTRRTQSTLEMRAQSSSLNNSPGDL